ncbi:glycosyltransferase [bacterium]|nr:glycosyltransferase [bacterium]
MTVRYSIIIPAFNATATLPGCIAALERQTIPRDQYEIIVIDDGSSDGTGFLAEELGARVLFMPRNGGQAAARNVGIAHSHGKITCFTDADCFPETDWLEQITAPLRNDPTLQAAKGAYLSDQTELTARFVQVEYEDKYDKLRSFKRISFVDTYSAAYRREVLDEVGGFDERFPIAEDRELSYRVAAAGHAMVFQPQALVRHIHANSIGSYFRKKMHNGFWAGKAVNLYPERQKEDSYTPQVLKIQVALMALLLGAIALAPLFTDMFYLAEATTVVYLGSTFPFIAKTWRKDRRVALASPFFLALRALALGFGYLGHHIRPLPAKSKPRGHPQALPASEIRRGL